MEGINKELAHPKGIHMKGHFIENSQAHQMAKAHRNSSIESQRIISGRWYVDTFLPCRCSKSL
jgi:hypothetical protein